jgi:hypothetical protein
MEAGPAPKGKSAGLPHLLKEAWPFLRPQRMLLLFGLVLMAINRLAGLVLPASTQVAAPAETRTPTGTERKIAQQRVRMEGWRQRRLGSEPKT